MAADQENIMIRRSKILGISALAIIAVVGVFMTIIVPSAAFAKDKEVTYSWYACDGLLAGDPSCPNISFASNGHEIRITGQGKLTDGTKSVSGEGTFMHKDADGNILGEGTWKATELLNFKTYGPGDPDLVPEDFRTGLARIRVDLMVGNEKVAEGILSIGCRLPGAKLPPSLFEGIKLNILGGLNFQMVDTDGPMPAGGVTLFTEE